MTDTPLGRTDAGSTSHSLSDSVFFSSFFQYSSSFSRDLVF